MVAVEIGESEHIESIQLKESAAPATPDSGFAAIYVKSDGRLYIKNDAGTEAQTGGALGVAQITPTELTIASGAITVTQGFHKIDTQADAGTDDLDTINGLVANAFYLFKPENVARIVKFKHGTGNIQSRTISDTVMTSTGIFGWSDGTNFYPITPSSPNDVDTWGNFAPDNSVTFISQDSTGEAYSHKGETMKLWTPFQFNADISFDAIAGLHALFDSTTAFTMTINASSIIAGMAWKAQVLQAPGAGTHKLLLPSGVSFNVGGDRAALFDNTADFLEGSFISATRFLLAPTTTGVTYSAS